MEDASGAWRSFVGSVVSVACTNGRHVEGTLLNVNRRSLWLVEGDHDVLIPLQDVTLVGTSPTPG